MPALTGLSDPLTLVLAHGVPLAGDRRLDHAVGLHDAAAGAIPVLHTLRLHLQAWRQREVVKAGVSALPRPL